MPLASFGTRYEKGNGFTRNRIYPLQPMRILDITEHFEGLSVTKLHVISDKSTYKCLCAHR